MVFNISSFVIRNHLGVYSNLTRMRPEHLRHVVRILKEEIRQWPVPAIGKYVETPFTVLISCLLSLRTQDRTTIAASDRLFAIAAAPQKMLKTPIAAIENA